MGCGGCPLLNALLFSLKYDFVSQPFTNKK